MEYEVKMNQQQDGERRQTKIFKYSSNAMFVTPVFLRNYVVEKAESMAYGSKAAVNFYVHCNGRNKTLHIAA